MIGHVVDRTRVVMPASTTTTTNRSSKHSDASSSHGARIDPDSAPCLDEAVVGHQVQTKATQAAAWVGAVLDAAHALSEVGVGVDRQICPSAQLTHQTVEHASICHVWRDLILVRIVIS